MNPISISRIVNRSGLAEVTGSGKALNGGRCWADPDLNTAEELAAGHFYFNVAIGPKSPAEQITATYSIDNSYTVQALGLSSSTSANG